MIFCRVCLLWFLLPLGCVVEAASRIAAVCQIEVNASTGSLTNGCIIAGSAWMDRQSWIAAASQPASYYWQFPINRMAWNQVGIQFTPTATTTLAFKLTGPWEEVTPGSGVLYKEEVLWDALVATGTAFINPGFESLDTDGAIAGWRGGTSETGSAAIPPVDGTRYASSWQQNSIFCTLRVTNGVPVTIQLYARASLPSEFTEMKRIAALDTPAHLTARKLMRGVNLSGLLELAPNDPRALSYSDRDFIQIRAEGFDHVRIPVGWHLYSGAGPDYTLSSIIFSRLDALVTYAFRQNLAVLVDWHGFDEFAATPLANTNKLFAVWRQVAEHYANYSANLCFELLNEEVPLAGAGPGAATSEVMNTVYAEAIRQIRATNPNRTIVTGTSGFDSIEELAHLRLPDNDSNLIVTVHCYDPFLFTHQGAEWTSRDCATVGVQYPGPPLTPLKPAITATNSWVVEWMNAYNALPAALNPSGPMAFKARFAQVQQWAEYFGRPVYLGEFGAYSKAPPDSRVNFYRDLRATLDACGIGWAVWDWKGGFSYSQNGLPNPPEMRSALFPSFQLASTAAGAFAFDAAIGKTFVVQKTLTLTNPVPWSSILTQTLITPKFSFSDAARNDPGAYYRVLWQKQ